MGKRLKVAIVGLPKFAKEFAERMQKVYPEHSFKSFDTYYNKKDQLKLLAYIPFSDVVYSINGAIDGSKVFDLAIKLRKKLIFHWVGTDVVKALNFFKSGDYNQKYIDYPTHLCEVSWIKEELKPMGIEAKIKNFVAFDFGDQELKTPEDFYVLSYIYPGREDFYGIEVLKEAAQKLPDIKFKIAGSEGKTVKPISNLEFLGWVNNFSEVIANAAVSVRIPKHDGLSSFVLESLSLGRQVIYNNPYNYCIWANSADELVDEILKIYHLWLKGEYQINEPARNFIKQEFHIEVITSGMLNEFQA